MSPPRCTIVLQPNTGAHNSKPQHLLHCLPTNQGPLLPTMHQAQCARPARECASAPRHSYPHRHAPQCNYAAHAPRAHHKQASSNHCAVPMMCRSGAVHHVTHALAPCAMRTASGGLKLIRLQRCLKVRCCSQSLVLVHAWSVRSTEHGTSSTACLQRCFRIDA